MMRQLRMMVIDRASHLVAFCAIVMCILLLMPVLSCQNPAPANRRDKAVELKAGRFVVALGNIRGNKPASETDARLAEFFFGVEPETPLGLIKPTSMAMANGVLFVCDPSQSSVFRFDSETGAMDPFRIEAGLRRPNAISSTGDGGFLVCDVGTNAVFLVDAEGKERRRFELENAEFRPADVLRVDREVWVTNAALHRIEVFDLEAGTHLRSIGSRGTAIGQFGFPLGMARGPDGRVYVADSLNQRVQTFDSDGTPRGVIGRQGDRIGSFGRPREVAVAPDGTVFVVDASSQRVHAFDRTGRAITAFGEPRGAKGELCIPAGIEIAATYAGAGANSLPPDFVPDCFVFVAEQLREPGVRVFAWRGTRDEGSPTFPPGQGVQIERRVSLVESPHWSASSCYTCHETDAGKPVAIDPTKIDTGCLACHDGVKAHAEAHPIGRSGHTDFANVPADWPLNQERLSCLTCHDIRRHCDAGAERPASNAIMLRGDATGRPLDFCTNCHTPSEQWRINPHRQLAEDGTVRSETCGFCHTSEPVSPMDGRRTNEPNLRASASGICLSCHAQHWDYFPEGHVDRPVTDEIRQRLFAREFMEARDSTASRPAAGFNEAVRDSGRSPVVLPLADNRVACYSCHNPHEPGLFPADSPLGRSASSTVDSELLLRMDRLTLCQTCHSK